MVASYDFKINIYILYWWRKKIIFILY